MARGFLGGVLSGAVVSTIVAGTVSVLAPPPVAPEVSDAAPGAVQPPQPAAVDSSGKSGSQTDTAVATQESAPQAPAPDPDTVADIDEAAQETAALPQTGQAGALDTPAADDDSAALPDAEAPVLPNPQANAPTQPVADTAAISTEPAQPVTTDDGTGDAAVAAEDAVTEQATETETPTDPTPQVTQADETPADPALQEEEPATQETAESDAVTVPVVPQITDETPPEDEAQPEAEIAEAAPETETESSDTEVAAARPVVGTPATSLLNRDTGVTINRPQSADATEATETALSDTPAQEADAEKSTRPVDRFAQPFEAPADKPLMSIVLIDDGTTPTAGAAGIAALRSFPYPLSFAVDSRLDDASDRIALYRDKGFEVMVMIDLPPGAQPVDAETTFAVVLAELDGVVGVLEGTGTGFQESRDLADQVSAIVAQTGHGLLTQSKGLNTMPKLARKQGVPASPIFRDFDSKDQTATVIRRFLDQAAFKAGQEGAVVMVGRMRPDTISALLLWGLQDRASSVALSPISAVLKRDPS